MKNYEENLEILKFLKELREHFQDEFRRLKSRKKFKKKIRNFES